jgi:hypothetical protein
MSKLYPVEKMQELPSDHKETSIASLVSKRKDFSFSQHKENIFDPIVKEGFILTCDKGSCIGVYRKDKVICISNVTADHFLRELIDFLVLFYETRHIIFANVVTDALEVRLRGFEKKKVIDPIYHEEITLLEGEWEERKDGNN